MKLVPIGIIHSPYKTKEEAPRSGRYNPNTVFEIEIFKEFKQGLKDVEGFSHLIVLYWLHKSDNYSLLVRTPWESNLHGLFSTRSPNRPNAIGFSVVKIIERKNNILKIKGLDAIDKTPVIDLKPYIPYSDSKNNVKIGWLSRIRENLSKEEIENIGKRCI